MRAILALVAVLVVGCGSSVAPTPIIVYVTPSPAPTATPTPTPAPQTPAPPTPSPAPVAATEPLPVLSAKVPGASQVKYYAVTGRSLSDLISDLASKCQATGWDCVSTDYTVNWTTSTNVASGACSITAASVEYKPVALDEHDSCSSGGSRLVDAGPPDDRLERDPGDQDPAELRQEAGLADGRSTLLDRQHDHQHLEEGGRGGERSVRRPRSRSRSTPRDTIRQPRASATSSFSGWQ